MGEPKTASSKRTITMPAPVVQALRARRRVQAAERLAAGPRWFDTGLVFTTAPGTPINDRNLRRELSLLSRQAGLGHWHPRELRHSTVSRLSAAGVPLEVVADVVGHSGTRMTAGVYRHTVTPAITEAVGPMETMFGN
jgi:integrase